MNKEFQFQQIKEADFPEIETLAIENGGNSSLNANALKHQYFNNPSKSFSFWKVIGQNKIEGYATTNNFQFILENKKIFVGMPQNVLVSEFARGSGLFGKLYNLTEKENKEEKGIDIFLTFTNGMSTPIFLQKFQYKRGVCPDLTFYISFIHFLKKDLNYVSLKNISNIDFENFKTPIQLNNSIVKNKAYYNWRYKTYDEKEIKVLKVIKKGEVVGFGILKVQKKKGISFLMLMDIITINEDSIYDIINVCRRYCAKNMFVGLLLFKSVFVKYPRTILKLNFKERFNFLVKGKTEIETRALSKLNYNFYLADMDSF